MIASLTRTFPSTKGIRGFNLAVLTLTPLIACYGLWQGRAHRGTVYFACFYYVFSMLGITAGYHRLWSHRSYNASYPLQLFLLAGGTSAVQGSCYWWARAHRSHHRHTDTDLDPYNANRGLLWTHIGWMIFKSEFHSGPSDVSDLKKDPLIQWQHHNYLWLVFVFGYIVPTLVPTLLFNDWLGGFCISGALRLTIAHHSTFCINSVAHWLGSAPYDDVLTPRDHLLSALLTMGEGYHNFHHQFPMDYRNAYLWYQYDPTKWFIGLCGKFGLASHLKVFPSNEIAKGRLSMQLKELKAVQDHLQWPVKTDELSVVSWETYQQQAQTRPLILIAGFIHDVSSLIDNHPGGQHHIVRNYGKDMTSAFFGGVYKHSNAAHNLLSMLRVGVLDGGVQMDPVLQTAPQATQLAVLQHERYSTSHPKTS
ncbi:delta 9-fatty acid desaturase protein [Panaeolus papilionaceus]|nr:delta 9-fatty acid desaturase protein [Panaeolus papilionaceus]